ncbi:MAG: fibronectin type III domain-containing protein [Lachnospiraceae bacterium]|nr:fibronectin type III domain-containing protein [Lachnospiraceae bacterium]
MKKLLEKLLSAFLAVTVIFFAAGPMSVSAKAKNGVAVNEKNFPDPIFRDCISKAFDEDGNGYLDSDEIFLVRNVHCENLGVSSIKGIEYFPYLKGLWCKGNHLTEMDLSHNPGLVGIWCSFNDFTDLDFSDCPDLEWVYCFNCNLKTLNVRNNPKLAYLECNANPELKELDLSQNTLLENLFASNCGLTSLDLSNNPELCDLTAFYNDLEYVDVSKNTKIKRLDIWHNERLKNIDVSNLKDLEYLNVAWTDMTKIDVSHNPKLYELVCGYNKSGKLKSIDLSQNPELSYLGVECNTELESLDLSHNPKLYYLMAFGLTQIEQIDISKNYRLCKAYNEGEYVHETENLGYVYSMTLDYGGSGDPFDQLRYCVAFDDNTKINAKFNGKNVPDSIIDTDDGHSDSEQFVTRYGAIQTLYELAGKPAVSGTSRFTDVPSECPYADAVRWGEVNNICFGYPILAEDTFSGNSLVTRQDFGLMAHRFATYMGLGTAFDYGRTDWFDDFTDIDFYAWGPFTWSVQFGVVYLEEGAKRCYPHGRITFAEFQSGLDNLMDLDEAASYSAIVGGNFGADYDPGNDETPSSVVKADKIGQIYVKLVWSALSGVDGYIVQTLDNGKWKKVRIIKGRTKTSAKITGLKAGTKYTYRVQSFTVKNGKRYAKDYCEAIDVTTRPTSVSKFNVTVSGNDLILSWNRNKKVSGYQLQMYKNGKWLVYETYSSNKHTETTVKGLEAGTYKFRIRTYIVSDGKRIYSRYNKIAANIE